MRNVGAFTVLVLIGCSSLPDGDDERFEVVARSQPVITSVTTDDGFTQIRQNATVALVIEGHKLGGTTSVRVGGFFTTLDRVAARRVRVTVSTFGDVPPGPLDVTLTMSSGTVVEPGAIVLTPFVVSPTAVAGHGTFQSPMNLCDPELRFATDNSLVLLLAGTHRCGRVIDIGSGTVTGDPVHATILTGTGDEGFAIRMGCSECISKIRDVTFMLPLAGASLFLGGGNLEIERVVDVRGISAGAGVARIDHYTYEGEGTALGLRFGEVRNSSIRHCGEGDGISVGAAPVDGGTFGASVLLDNVVVEGCAHGLVTTRFQDGPSFFSTSVQVSNSQFLDNGIGIDLDHSTGQISNTVVRTVASSPDANTIGITIRGGPNALTDVEISGYDVGLSLDHLISDNHHANVTVERLVINGGRIGISTQGVDNFFSVRNSLVRDQTEAALFLSNRDGRADLGTSSSPGNNALSVVSGFTIVDVRSSQTFQRYTRAAGTTLNGVSFDGQTIDGPAELAPFWRISDSVGIQF